jgi:hypothetical protein
MSNKTTMPDEPDETTQDNETEETAPHSSISLWEYPETERLWRTYLEWLEEEQPETIARLLKQGRQALWTFLRDRLNQAWNVEYQLTEKGVDNWEAESEAAKWLMPMNSRTEIPAPLEPYLKQMLVQFKNWIQVQYETDGTEIDRT